MVSEDDASLVGERLGLPGQYDGTCGKKFNVLEAMLDRVQR